MRSTHETGGTETKPRDEPEPRPQRRPAPEGSEAAYERLSAYAFARRYVGGKAVADIVVGQGEGEAGYGTYGSLLLAETAESVAVLLSSGSPEAESTAWAVRRAPNVSYRGVELPKLPHPEDSVDVVVMLRVPEELVHPDELLREAKRVLKKVGGVLLLYASD